MQPALQKEARRRADARAAGPLAVGILQVSHHARYNVPLFTRTRYDVTKQLSPASLAVHLVELASRLPYSFAVLFVRYPKKLNGILRFSGFTLASSHSRARVTMSANPPKLKFSLVVSCFSATLFGGNRAYLSMKILGFLRFRRLFFMLHFLALFCTFGQPPKRMIPCVLLALRPF